MKTALIIVDVQYDFLPGGALAVPNGNSIIKRINKIMPQYDLVVATRDYHPVNHTSFALWPEHCVQNTRGAELSKALHTNHIDKIIFKGMNSEVDSYSGFFENDGKTSTELHKYLQANQVAHVHIVGLATDYCVKHTALDAARLGYVVTVLIDCCRGIDDKSIAQALEEMEAAGIKLLKGISGFPLSRE